MSTLNNNIIIISKIVVSILCLLGIILMISFENWQVMEITAGQFQKVDDMDQLIAYLTEARRAEKNYILYRHSQHRAEVYAFLDKIQEKAMGTLNKQAQNTDNKKQMEVVVAASDNYRNVFSEYTQLDQKRAAEMENMQLASQYAMAEFDAVWANLKGQLVTMTAQRGNISAQVNEKLLKADYANGMVKIFLEVRKNEKEFLLSNQENYLEQVKAGIAAIRKMGAALMTKPSNKAKMHHVKKALKALEQYELGFANYVDIKRQQEASDKLLAQVAQRATQVSVEALRDQKAKMLQQMAFANRMISLGTGLGFFLGVFIAWFFLRSIINELTQRNQTETKLFASEARLRNVVENMPIMMLAMDENNKVLVWNRECERVTGYSHQEIMAQPDLFAVLFPDPKIQARIMTEWAQRGQDYRGWELPFSCKDDQVRTVLWSNLSEEFPVPGWPNWSVGFDVSEQRALQESIKMLKTELEMGERKRLAQIIHDGVGQGMQALHLGLVMVAAHLEKGEEISPKLVAGIIADSNDIITQIRGISSELHPTFLERMDLVDTFILWGEKLEQLSGKNFQIYADADIPELTLQEKYNLFRCFQESLNNAAKYAHAERIDVTLEMLPNERLSLKIADNGCGFDVAATRKSSSGLGLSLIEERVFSLGGYAEIQSQPGQGTTISIIVPM